MNDIGDCTTNDRKCTDDKVCCGFRHPRDSKIRCTRNVAHEGPHIACGVNIHNIVKWPWSKEEAYEQNTLE